MKSKCLSISLVLLIALSGLISVGCAEKPDTLTPEYKALQKDLAGKIKEIKSQEAYNNFKKERKEKLETLLKKVETAEKRDSHTLLKANLLMDLGKTEESAKEFDSLIKNNSKFMAEAKFGKVRYMLSQNKVKEALELFKGIEAKLQKDAIFISTLLHFAYSMEEVSAEYAEKILKHTEGKIEFEENRTPAYRILASTYKEKGDIPTAIKTLEKALAETKDEGNKKRLNGALTQLKMLNSPAPDFPATTWLNSKPIKGTADLKGKVIVLDFFAPWCPPCRKVLPDLVKSYEQLKDKGLVVISYTKLYGNYRDDKINKGKVTPEEELNLIKGFVERYNMKYPVAVADNSEIFDAYGVSGIPTIIIIDKEGKIADVSTGAGDHAKMEAMLEKLLK